MQKPSLKTMVTISSIYLLGACGQNAVQDALSLAQNQSLSASAQEGLSGVNLTDSGSTPESEESASVRQKGWVERLSAEAKLSFDKVVVALEAIRSEKESICAHDSALRESIKSQLKAIHDDASLSHEEKHSKKEALLASNKEALAADREAFQTCVSEHVAELQVIEDKAVALVTACGLPKHEGPGAGRMHLHNPGDMGPDQGRGAGHGPGDRGPKGGHGPDDQLDLQALEQSLLSDTCKAAL